MDLILAIKPKSTPGPIKTKTDMASKSRTVPINDSARVTSAIMIAGRLPRTQRGGVYSILNPSASMKIHALSMVSVQVQENRLR